MGQNGGASRWRVCYQRGLPRLVFLEGGYLVGDIPPGHSVEGVQVHVNVVIRLHLLKGHSKKIGHNDTQYWIRQGLILDMYVLNGSSSSISSRSLYRCQTKKTHSPPKSPGGKKQQPTCGPSLSCRSGS